MKALAVGLSVLLLAACGHKIQTKPRPFGVEYRYTPGIEGQTAQVNTPWRFGIFYTGILPDTPTCLELSINDMPGQVSCGFIGSRYMLLTVTVPLAEYLMQNPRPYGRELLGVGERDEVLPWLGIDASEQTYPHFRLRIRVYEAAPNYYGMLVPLKNCLVHKVSRKIRLECRHCTW